MSVVIKSESENDELVSNEEKITTVVLIILVVLLGSWIYSKNYHVDSPELSSHLNARWGEELLQLQKRDVMEITLEIDSSIGDCSVMVDYESKSIENGLIEIDDIVVEKRVGCRIEGYIDDLAIVFRDGEWIVTVDADYKEMEPSSYHSVIFYAIAGVSAHIKAVETNNNLWKLPDQK
jgi:hypothetical protein